MFEVYNRKQKKHISIDEHGIQLIEIKKELVPRYTITVSKDDVVYEKKMNSKVFDEERAELVKLFNNLQIKEISN